MNLLTRRIFNSISKSLTIKECFNAQAMIVNSFHSHQVLSAKRKRPTADVSAIYFKATEKKEKDAFLEIIRLHIKEDTLQRGHTRFILTALKYMDEFGVNKDLETYKALLDVFPKGEFIPTNAYQAMLFHYPKQQNTALELLTKMEENYVIPDYEMQQMILNIFGIKSIVIRKCWRMLYWMPKFAHLNPWPVPTPAPTDPREIAVLAMEKICSIDVQATVTEYRTADVPDAIDNTWIVSTMSRSQQELLAVQPTDKSLTIEGPFFVWIGTNCIDYFVLKGEPIKREIIYEDYDDVSDLKIPFWEKHNFGIPVTAHEQHDGVYYAMCATGTSSKDSLLSWIRCLQKTNPVLERIPIVFKLKTVTQEIKFVEEGVQKSDVKQLPDSTDTLKK